MKDIISLEHIELNHKKDNVLWQIFDISEERNEKLCNWLAGQSNLISVNIENIINNLTFSDKEKIYLISLESMRVFGERIEKKTNLDLNHL